MPEVKKKVFETKQPAFLEKFVCLGDDCEDTCCKGWGMQVDAPRKKLYEKDAPELLDAITSGESEIIMRRDPETDHCVKFDNGLCGIHKKYGTKFLGDACHFYPRATRKLSKRIVMTAALSCPEITRLAIFGDNPFELRDVKVDRVPVELKNYSESKDGIEDIELIQKFIELAGDENYSPERSLAIILTICKSLKSQPQDKWPEAFDFYQKIAQSLLLSPKGHFSDYYRLVNILVALIQASKKTERLRLDETVSTMENTLKIRIDRQTLQIKSYSGGDFTAHTQLINKWHDGGAGKKLAPILRRWLQAQISMNSFPYAGLGKNLAERRLILAVRFATVRLALMCHIDTDGNPPDDETTVRIIQSISRFYDHLSDPTMSLLAYTEAGWNQDAHLRSLIGDRL